MAMKECEWAHQERAEEQRITNDGVGQARSSWLDKGRNEERRAMYTPSGHNGSGHAKRHPLVSRTHRAYVTVAIRLSEPAS